MNKIKAAIFLAPGFQTSEAVITIDILRRANIPVDIVSLSPQLLVKSSLNMTINCEKEINKINFNDYKILILPGGTLGVANLNKNQLLKKHLVDFANDKNKFVAAICAAPQILGQLNLLNNKRVTFYPGCDKDLDLAIKTTQPVIVSDNIITGKSVGCAFQFALQIVTILLGQDSSNKVRQELEF
ncbi:MAG: DJ-1/PfpI family protein [Spiroplasma sp.]|nr:DJ-1/PfpI family protein [Spiroplasma sp.]